jgi:DNA-dependent protein kinase catalytic subunit
MLLNLRLFFLKLIINKPDIFAPYAGHWFEPFMTAITFSSSYGEGINYFVQDLTAFLLVCLQEVPNVPLSARAKAPLMIDRFCSNAFSESSRIVQNNLEILNSLVAALKDHVRTPTV